MGREEGIGLTQTIPIFTSFGPSMPDPGFTEKYTRRFTLRIILFSEAPDQALWGLPRRQELKSHYVPSLFQHHPFGLLSSPPTSQDQALETWA